MTTSLAETPQLDLQLVLRGAERMVVALDFIHSKDLVHMDVKPGNVFLSNMSEWFLGDFGSCRRKGEPIISYTECFYPVSLFGEAADPKYDWYMLLVTILSELSTDKRHWMDDLMIDGKVDDNLVQAAVNGFADPEVKTLLQQILSNCSNLR
jgi:serine/threonine protein kinase